MVNSHITPRERAVEAIYATALDPPSWPETLQAIADLTGDVGAVLVFEREDGRFGHVVSESLQPMLDDFVNNYRDDDLRAVRARERHIYLNRDVATDFDVASPEEMESHPYYVMLRRHDLKYCAGVSLLPSPDVSVLISVQRSRRREPFSPQELQLLVEVCRHAESALRLSVRLADADLVSQTLQDAFERLRIGVLTLDSRRRVVFANASAKRLLGDGISIHNNQLGLNATDEKQARDAIEAAMNGQGVAGAPRPILVQRSSSDRPLVVYVLPVIGDSPWRQAIGQVRAILLVMDLQGGERADPAAVRDVFGLTLGEAKLASLIAVGASPREAAKELGLTEESARTILKRVYEKTGISRQNKLASALSRLALK